MSRISTPGGLRIALGALFLGLAIPATILIRAGFGQLELDALRDEQRLAEAVVQRIDAQLAAAVAIEDTRPLEHYSFASTGSIARRTLRSPLSFLPVASAVPGTVGYFEVDADGQLSTPLVPQSADVGRAFDIGAAELVDRQSIEGRMRVILAENRLLGAREPELPQAAEPAFADGAGQRLERVSSEQGRARGQAAFDELDAPLRTGPILTGAQTAVPPGVEPALAPNDEVASEALGGATPASGESARTQAEDTAADASAGAGASESGAREDRAGDPSANALSGNGPAMSDAAGIDLDYARVAAFARELEPMRFSRLQSGNYVLFRNAWRDGQRFVQGLLIDAQGFLDGVIEPGFEPSGLAPGTTLAVTVAGERSGVLTMPGAAGSPDAETLVSARLSPPMADIELQLRAGSLSRGPAWRALLFAAVALFAILIAGLAFMYRFGMRQIELVRQQRAFVSAVSHELKTPLTSIRMYAEMLKSDWASEENKRSYYDFIYAEGERLSRLIDNVLQLARLDRGGPPVDLGEASVASILDMAKSKLSTQIEQAGMRLTIDVEPGLEAAGVLIDEDALTQVLINLVDNAIKFAADCSPPEIQLTAGRFDDERIVFSIRDFGPGIRPADMKRLFELFYRPDNEMTRSKAGTGIGLSLVRQLVTAMRGRVDVRHMDPGTEFRIILPRA